MCAVLDKAYRVKNWTETAGKSPTALPWVIHSFRRGQQDGLSLCFTSDDLPTPGTCIALVALVWKTAQVLPLGNHSSSC